MAHSTHGVVVIGGGFGGLAVVRGLRRETAVATTLVDRRNFHLFQPLLYQVATAGLSPANIASPLRHLLRHYRRCDVVLSEVQGFDLSTRRVILTDGEVPYDTLVVAAGSKTGYFGRRDFEAATLGLKDVEDAISMRRRLLGAFERADRCADPTERAAWLTFAVVGGGPTGVELAGAAAEIARDFLRVEFRHLHQERARIVLVDVAPRILPAFHPSLSAAAARALEDLGVEVHVGVKVVAITESAVTTDDPKLLTIPTKTSLWAAGVEASPLARLLGEAAGLDVDRAGRVPVTPQLTLDGHPEVFVIGDMARCEGGDGVPLPGVAPVAIQQGRHVARTIRRRLRALPPTSFTYSGRGNLATIGRSRAVAQLGSWRFSGRFAWWVWLFIHLMQLVSLQNRLLVLIQWAGTYVTRNRSARIITLPDRGHDPRPEQHQPGVRERDHQKP